jgi:tetratricopeptide (TPR) repeat protein
LFLVTTLAAIAAAVLAADLGLGVWFLIVAVPALVRTIRVISRRNFLGSASTLSEKLGIFIRSTGVALLLLLCVATVLYAACLGAVVGSAALSSIGERARNAGAVGGTLAGLVLSGWLLWCIWHFVTAARRAMSLNNEGTACFKRGDIDRALALFSIAAQLNPKLVAAHINRAIVYCAKREWATALAAMDLAIALEPDRALSYNDRGGMLLDSGDANAALASLSDAIRLDPTNAQFYCNRAGALHRLGRLNNALHDFERALEIEPTLNVYSVLGLLRHEMGESDRGLADLNRAIQIDPEFAVAYNNRGFIKAAQGDRSGAIADYETAIRLAPDHPNAHKNLAWLQATAADARYRDGAKAVTHAQRALELSDGAQPQWLEILAAAHAECGDFKAAIAWQTKAIEAAGEQAADEMSTRLANYVRLEPYRV